MPVATDFTFSFEIIYLFQTEFSSPLAGICAWFTILLNLKSARLLRVSFQLIEF